MMADRPGYMWETIQESAGMATTATTIGTGIPPSQVSTTSPTYHISSRLSGSADMSFNNHTNGSLPVPYDNGLLPGSIASASNNNNHHSGLPSHLIVPQPMKPPPSKRSYQCKTCDQMFETRSDMLLHCQQLHKQDPKPYKCPQCQKCFANSSYLSQHNRIHAGIKPYRCEICDRKFTQLSHLQQHMRTHTGEKPYKCRHAGCEKAFSQLANLQQHSRSHMTDKPYRCNSCYKCFTSEQGLREHIPKHNETKHLKTQICPTCGKSYTQETYLERHMMKHNGGRPASQIEQRRSSSQSSDILNENADVNVKEENERNFAYPCNENLIRGKLERVGDDQYPYITRDDPLKKGTPAMLIPTCNSSAFNTFGSLGSHLPTSSLQPGGIFATTLPNTLSGGLSPPLPHISSMNTRYFPYDRPTANSNMIANSLLSLQHIQNYTRQTNLGHNMQ